MQIELQYGLPNIGRIEEDLIEKDTKEDKREKSETSRAERKETNAEFLIDYNNYYHFGGY